MTHSVTLSARELDSWLGLWVRIHLEVFEKPTDARLWKEWHAVTIGEEITNDWAVLGETLLEMWEARTNSRRIRSPRQPAPQRERCIALIERRDGNDGQCKNRSVYFCLCVKHYQMDCSHPIRKV